MTMEIKKMSNKNPLNLLNRLFRRNPSNVAVSALYSKMTQPLFVHPELGGAVMKSYLDIMRNSVTSLNGSDDDMSSLVTSVENGIAVIDVSGALVAREEATPCGQSPASYEGIKADMTHLLMNENIHTIVGRFDSPGGMASQNMDLSDFIFENRGKGTKLIAMVDDMAYSAAFGIATAFDQIVLTRTSGVGSVGVVSYHVDQSEANKRAGIKVEYIYAGAKKVLGNPHEPLSDEARDEHQKEVSSLYELFTHTVARNLGIKQDAVKATEAGTYHGQDAIDVGFAHKLMTFDNLMSLLMKNDDTDGPLMIDGKMYVEATTEQIETMQSKVNQENDGESDNEDIPSDSTIEEIVDDIDDVEQLRQDADEKLASYKASVEALCLVARVPIESAAKFIEANMSIDDVRTNLMTMTVNEDNDVTVSAISEPVLKDKKAKVKKGWDDAFDKVSSS